MQWSAGEAVPVFDNHNVVSAANAELQTALDQLFLAHFSQTVGIACSTPLVSLRCTASARDHLPLLKHKILT
jgi:hypothetical protein